MTRNSLKWAALTAVLGTLAFGQKAKTPKEGEALMAIQSATDDSGRIKAVENLLTKFADTEFKGLALEIAMDSALRMNDGDMATIYAERILDSYPNNLNALSTLAKATSQRIGENDLDREDKLKKVDELGGKALALAPDAKSPYPQLWPPDQWATHKTDYVADAHYALAAAAMVRKKYDVALTEYQASLASRKDPATMVRIGQVYNAQGKSEEAIAILDQVLAMSDAHPVVKQLAGKEKVKAVMAKAKTPKPAVETAKPQ